MSPPSGCRFNTRCPIVQEKCGRPDLTDVGLVVLLGASVAVAIARATAPPPPPGWPKGVSNAPVLPTVMASGAVLLLAATGTLGLAVTARSLGVVIVGLAVVIARFLSGVPRLSSVGGSAGA